MKIIAIIPNGGANPSGIVSIIEFRRAESVEDAVNAFASQGTIVDPSDFTGIDTGWIAGGSELRSPLIWKYDHDTSQLVEDLDSVKVMLRKNIDQHMDRRFDILLFEFPRESSDFFSCNKESRHNLSDVSVAIDRNSFGFPLVIFTADGKKELSIASEDFDELFSAHTTATRIERDLGVAATRGVNLAITVQSARSAADSYLNLSA